MKPSVRGLMTRRNFAAVLAAGAGMAGWMRYVAAESLEVVEHQVKLRPKGLVQPIRLVHLSDFHASPVVSLEFIQKSIDLSLAQNPDLVCLTGDFITTTYDDLPRFGSILKRLSDRVPTFACLGNHDGGNWARKAGGYPSWGPVREMLEQCGITVLHNAVKPIRIKNVELQMAGLGDMWAQECLPHIAFSQADPALPTVLLSHNPDSKTLAVRYPYDLMLCGHTHGGQLSLPLIGTPFAPVRDKRFVAGLHRWEDRYMHITKGVGNLHGMRFNCPPEVSVLILT